MNFKIKVLPVIIVILFSLKSHPLHAQFLKNILNSVKQTSQNNTTNKVDQATNKALDKIDNLGKKKSKGTATSSGSAADTVKPSANNTAAQRANAGSNNNNNAAPQNDPYNSNGSFISLNLSSDRIIATGAVQITGSSIKYKNFNAVTLTITTLDGTGKESRIVPMDTSGAYSTVWQLNSDGDYIVNAKSSDGKSSVNKSLGVFKAEDIDSVIEPLKKVITRASEKLTKDIDQVKSAITGQDAGALQKKMDDFTDKKDKVLKQLDDIATAGKGLTNVEKKYGGLPPSVSKNISDLTNEISTQTRQVEQAIAATDHKSYDNSVCEYLVMVSEACAAFSTFVNFEGDLLKVFTNIAGDKADRAVAGYAAGGVTGGSDAAAQAAGECASLFVGARTETEALKSKFGFASFGGDIVHMCSDLLLKKYCAVMSGELSHNYQCTYRNKSSDVWWDYSYATKANINLRYPKNNAGGNIIKMKGNIDGNATKFTIYQSAQDIDEYKDAMKGRERFTKFYSICLHKPVALPFSAAAADKGVGFGAVARTLATPACFNIPIDADYDVAQKKLTIYVNDALVDFTPVVCYIYGYVVIAAGIPLVSRVNFPIQTVKLTLGKVISQNQNFDVKMDAKNNLSVEGKGKTQIGDESSSIEHHISFSFSLKSDN